MSKESLLIARVCVCIEREGEECVCSRSVSLFPGAARREEIYF